MLSPNTRVFFFLRQDQPVLFHLRALPFYMQMPLSSLAISGVF